MNIQRWSFADVLKKNAPENFGKFATFLEKRIQHKRFPVNLWNFLRATLWQNTSGRLLCHIDLKLTILKHAVKGNHVPNTEIFQPDQWFFFLKSKEYIFIFYCWRMKVPVMACFNNLLWLKYTISALLKWKCFPKFLMIQLMYWHHCNSLQASLPHKIGR